MSYTQRFSEGYCPLATEYADSRGPVAHQSAYLDMMTYHRGFLLLNVGELQAGATLTCQLWEAQDNVGTGAQLITGKAITQLTQAGGDGDELIGIELRTEEMTPGYRYAQVRVTVAGAAVEFAYTYFGLISRYEEVPTTAWSEVVL